MKDFICPAILLTLAISGSFISLSSRANADSRTALAEKLFQDGRKLYTKGQFKEACPKFEESYRLDPGSGTLLNMAACHDKRGKTATAWSEYELARQKLEQAGDDRLRFAQTESQRLEAILSYLTVDVPREAALEGLILRLDGTQLGEPLWGSRSPLDPGEHELTASAPGYQPWTMKVSIGAESDDVVVEIPRLSPNAEEMQKDEQSVAAESSGFSTAVLVAGSTTLALGALFTVSGIIYIDQYEDPQKRSSAETWGVVNLIGAGGAILGAGLTTYLLASDETETSAGAVRLSPWVTQTGAGAAVLGRF